MQIGSYKCELFSGSLKNISKISYLIYPEILPLQVEWLEKMTNISNGAVAVVYVPAAMWNNSLTPWPEPGETKTAPPFGGDAPEFLNQLINDIVPAIEAQMSASSLVKRDIIGVSLAGLFTLWQWLQNNTFDSIGCLSGSFWYIGFIEWFEKTTIPKKAGKAFFLLGDKEPQSHIKAFRSVGENTQKIVDRLKEKDVDVDFCWVEGNHFADPLGRAELAFSKLRFS